MKTNKSFYLVAVLVTISVIVSVFLVKQNRPDNFETKTVTALISKKEISPATTRQEHYYVGKQMKTTTVQKPQEFLVFVKIDNDEVSKAVSESEYNNFQVNDKVTVKYKELGFPTYKLIETITKK